MGFSKPAITLFLRLKRGCINGSYDARVNERLMQTTEEKVDSSKALDASLVDTESSGTTFKEARYKQRSG
ncbi:hypothetical protein Tco_1006904 [Tanacetum coccineum]|uniref:Uncharacterized protein n=1 Tax=Tanacetum coccineum TaxID=301880 RepID=A0ABQ5FJ72_9ASTR